MKHLLPVFFCFAVVFANAQSNEHFIISSQGNYDSGSDMTLSWTLGDVATETISHENGLLTQGFQQPYIVVEEITEPTVQTDFEAKVYPNPFSNEITVDIENSDREYTLEVFDFSGKLMISNESSDPKYQLDLSDLAAAQYLLRLRLNESDDYKTFTIIKSQ